MQVKELTAVDELPYALYHESGSLLKDAGESLYSTEIETLAETGVEVVVTFDDEENISRFRHDAVNRTIPVSDLETGQRLSRPLYQRDGTLLLKAGSIITDSIKESFQRRRIDTVFVERGREELHLDQVEVFREASREIKEKRADGVADEIARGAETQMTSAVGLEGLERSIAEGMILEKPSGEPMQKILQKVNPTKTRTAAEKDDYLKFHRDAEKQTEKLFGDLASRSTVPAAKISGVARKAVAALIRDRDLLLNLSSMKGAGGYLRAHSINVCLLSINIGTELGYGKNQIMELAYGAFLHDIGMLKIPPAILTKPSPLTQRERFEVHKHPIHGINLLQKVSGIPRSTPFVVYQVHERLDKSGYPKARPGSLIHEYAKIVAIADVYEALTAPRAYRKAVAPYTAMEHVIRESAEGRLDPKIVRAFLRCASLFPVGSWVKLSDGKMAKVLAANADDYTKPVVRVMYDDGKRIHPPKTIDLTRETEISVVQAADEVPPGEEMMEGF